MSDTREIITLQFGNFANHVGCHFWNIQVRKTRNIIDFGFSLFTCFLGKFV